MPIDPNTRVSVFITMTQLYQTSGKKSFISTHDTPLSLLFTKNTKESEIKFCANKNREKKYYTIYLFIHFLFTSSSRQTW